MKRILLLVMTLFWCVSCAKTGPSSESGDLTGIFRGTPVLPDGSYSTGDNITPYYDNQANRYNSCRAETVQNDTDCQICYIT